LDIFLGSYCQDLSWWKSVAGVSEEESGGRRFSSCRAVENLCLGGVIALVTFLAVAVLVGLVESLVAELSFYLVAFEVLVAVVWAVGLALFLSLLLRTL
jgi:hypothetical protein